MATKELAVKFTEIGLQELAKRSQATADKIGRDFEGAIKRIQAIASQRAAAQAGATGPVEVDSAKFEQQWQKDAATLNRILGTAFKQLRVQSDASFKGIREAGTSAFHAIQIAAQTMGIVSQNEIERARASLAVMARNSGLAETAMPAELTAAFKRFGVESAHAVEQARKTILADLKLIEESGKATAEEITQAQHGMLAELQKLDLRHATQAFKTLGVVSKQAADDAKREWLQAFKEIEARGNAHDTALAARALNQKFAEIDKSRDLTQDLLPTPKATDPFQVLGFRSTETLHKLRDEAKLAFETIAKSADKGSRDAVVALQRLEAVLKDIDKELEIKVDTVSIEESFRALGIRSEEAIRKLQEANREHFAKITADGTKSAKDIANAFKAMERLNKELEIQFKDEKVKEELSEVEKAFRDLGAHSEAEIEELKKKAVADFEVIKNSGEKTAEEIERAFQAMNIRIKDADNLRLPVNERRTPNAPTPKTDFDKLNISSLADFKAKQQEIVDAYNRIAAAAGRGSADAIRAHNAMRTSLQALNEEFRQQYGAIQGSDSNWRKLLFTVSGVTLAVSGLIFVMKSLALTVASPFKAIGELEGGFEKFEATLRSLGDTSFRAGQSAAWVKDFVFSNKTVFSTDAVTDAFVKMRAVGIDPTKGSLEALLNAIAATGGSEEKLNRAAFAIQQIASKGRAYSEEVIQQLSEALPGTVKIVAQAFGFAADDTGKLLEEMKKKGIGARDFLQKLFEQLQKNFGDAGKEFMNTYPGILLQFKNLYQRFLDDTANAGAFQGLKQALQDILADLNKAFTDGRAQVWAKQLSDVLVGILKAGRDIVTFFKEWGKELAAFAKYLAIFYALRSAIQGILTLAAGFAAMRTAILAWAGALTVAQGGMIALARTATVALGPLGWLVGLGAAFLVAANNASDYADKVRDAKKANEEFERSKKRGGPQQAIDPEERVRASDGKATALAQIKDIEKHNKQLQDELESASGTWARELEKQINKNIAKIKSLRNEIATVFDPVINAKTDEEIGNQRFTERAIDEGGNGIGGLDGTANSGKPEDQDQINARIRALRIQRIQDQIERVRTAAKVEIDLEEAKYKQQLIGINEFYDNRIRIEKAALKKEADLFGQAAGIARTSPVKDEAERLEVEAKVSNLLGEQEKARIRLKAVEDVANADRVKALETFDAKLKQLDIDNERFQGNRAGAEELRLKRFYEALRKEIEANFRNDPPALALRLDQARINEELAKARTRFTDFEQQFANAGQLNQLSNEQALINRSLGTDTRLETVEKLNANSKTYLATLQKISDEMGAEIDRTRAAGAETAALEVRWQRVLVEMGRVRVAMDENGNLFKKTFIDGFQGFFDRVIDGTDRIGMSWRKLGQDLRNTFLKLIAEDLIGKLFRTSKDGKGNPEQGIIDRLGSFMGQVIRGPEAGPRRPAPTINTAALPQRDDEGNVMPGVPVDDEGNPMPPVPQKEAKDQIETQIGGLTGLLIDGFSGMFGKLGGVLKVIMGSFGDDLGKMLKEGFKLVKGLFGFAEGGLFRGAGTGTSDSNIIAVSDHEYIMPAKETRAWLPVLETMRAGKFGDWLAGIGGLVQGIRVPTSARFAQGGLVNGQSLAPQVQVLQTKTPATSVNLKLEPQMINMTLRDWLEGELGRIAATR